MVGLSMGASTVLMAAGLELPDSASANEAMANCKVPVLFIHGEADSLIPCEMGKVNYEACMAEKELFLVPEADHGISYLHDAKKYMEVTKAFIKRSFEK